jgi:non-haem Fe2+, alpha-ketoglutarate-dependent halogenase
MPQVLTEAQVTQFNELGYVAGIPVLSPVEAADALEKLRVWERSSGKSVKEVMRGKAHLLLKCLSDLIHHPRLVASLQDVLGPNVLCLESGFFWKNPRDSSFVSWHQDNTYLQLQPPAALAAWLALTDSKPDNGALKVIPGSQAQGDLAYDLIPGENNMLKFSRQVRDIDTQKAVHIELEPGQISMHANHVVHGSEANGSDRPRIGWSCIYAAPHARMTARGAMGATLVAGEDTHGYYEMEPIPRFDFDPVAVAAYERSMSGPLSIYKPK